MIAAVPLFAAALTASPLGGTRREVLDNGMVVLVQEDRTTPLVTVGVMYKVGARNEAAGTTGLAHYCEHMNFRATRALPGVEITDAITRIGGRWQGYTWLDQTWYAETVPRDAMLRMFDFEHQRMTAALYDPQDFTKERTSVLAELNSYDGPHDLLYDAVLAASFEIHPYRNNTIGWASDVEGVTRDEAYRFYRRYYHPNNAVLVVVGDLQAETTLRTIRERFGSLPAAGEASAVRTLEPRQTGQKRVVVRRPGPNAEVLIAFRAPALSDPDFFPMVLFDALLAGGKGFRFRHVYATGEASLLETRTASVAARTRSEWQASTYPYVYTLTAELPAAGGLSAAEQALFTAIAEAVLREWSDAEIERARRDVRRGYLADLDDKPGRAHQLAFYEVAGGIEYLIEAMDRLARVTRRDLRRFAQQWLTPERATVGWFEPVSAEVAAPSETSEAGASGGVANETPTPRSTPASPRMPAASASPAAMVAAANEGAGSPTNVVLANGVRGAIAPRAGAGLFALAGRIDAGPVYDGANVGLSALLAERLATISNSDAAGPRLGFLLHDDPFDAANQRWIEFSASGLPDELEPLLVRLGRALVASRTRPSDAELGKLRTAAIERATSNDASLDARWLRAARTRLFGASATLAAPPWGESSRLGAIEASDLETEAGTRVVGSRVSVAVSGGIDLATLRPLLERTFGPLPAGRTSPAPTAVRSQASERWTEERLHEAGKAQNEIRVAWPGDRSKPFDDIATQALLYLLGETGYAGRLGRALVDPGLVYSVYTTLEEDGAPGFFAIRTAAAASDTPEVLRRIREILDSSTRGTFTDSELQEAESYLAGKRARSYEGSVTTAVTLVRHATRPLSTTPLTLAQLNDTARRLFARGAPVVFVAGPGYETRSSPEVKP